MAHYIRDTFNPRGAEYGATSRAADYAESTKNSMDDMLALAMAPDEDARRAVAQRIHDRKVIEGRNAGIGQIFKYVIFAAIAVFCVLVYQLGDDSSAVSGAYRAFMATPTHSAPRVANAPVRSEIAHAPTHSSKQLYRDLPDLVDGSNICLDPSNSADVACKANKR